MQEIDLKVVEAKVSFEIRTWFKYAHALIGTKLNSSTPT